jgi:zinc protease
MKKISCIILSFCSFASWAKEIDIQHWQTHSGAKVLFVKQTELPMIDLNIAFKAGSAYDGKNWGIANLTANLMDQGANNFDATKIAEKFEDYGAQFSVSVDRDKAIFSLRTLTYTESLNKTIDTLAMILSKPDFKELSVEREKRQQLTTIHYMAEKPSSVASNTFYSKLYPTHPYGHSVYGTQATVAPITRKQIQAFYRKHYTSENATIAIVGNLTTNQARTLTETLSNRFLSNQTSLSALPVPNKEHQKEEVKVNFPVSQTTIVMGQVGITHKSPFYFPLKVGNYILGGGGLVSKLSEEVREKRGLTYGVYSSFNTYAQPGPFSINLATQTAQTDQALEVTQQTLQNFLTKGPSEKELQSAKNYLVGSFPLQMSSNKSIAAIILNMGYYDLPLNYINTYLSKIESVSTADIKNAFLETVQPNNMLTVMVGQFETKQ